MLPSRPHAMLLWPEALLSYHRLPAVTRGLCCSQSSAFVTWLWGREWEALQSKSSWGSLEDCGRLGALWGLCLGVSNLQSCENWTEQQLRSSTPALLMAFFCSCIHILWLNWLVRNQRFLRLVWTTSVRYYTRLVHPLLDGWWDDLLESLLALLSVVTKEMLQWRWKCWWIAVVNLLCSQWTNTDNWNWNRWLCLWSK